jgi:hypothetical protein
MLHISIASFMFYALCIRFLRDRQYKTWVWVYRSCFWHNYPYQPISPTCSLSTSSKIFQLSKHQDRLIAVQHHRALAYGNSNKINCNILVSSNLNSIWTYHHCDSPLVFKIHLCPFRSPSPTSPPLSFTTPFDPYYSSQIQMYPPLKYV